MISVSDPTLAVHEHAVVRHTLEFTEVQHHLTRAEVGEDRVIVRIGVVHYEGVRWYLHRVVGRPELAIWTRNLPTERILSVGMLDLLEFGEVRPGGHLFLLVRTLVEAGKLGLETHFFFPVRATAG